MKDNYTFWPEILKAGVLSNYYLNRDWMNLNKMSCIWDVENLFHFWDGVE